MLKLIFNGIAGGACVVLMAVVGGVVVVVVLVSCIANYSTQAI